VWSVSRWLARQEKAMRKSRGPLGTSTGSTPPWLVVVFVVRWLRLCAAGFHPRGGRGGRILEVLVTSICPEDSRRPPRGNSERLPPSHAPLQLLAHPLRPPHPPSLLTWLARYAPAQLTPRQRSFGRDIFLTPDETLEPRALLSCIHSTRRPTSPQVRNLTLNWKANPNL